MIKATFITAGLLILVGLVGFFFGHPNPETGKVSMTALIPAYIGIAFAVAGLIGLKTSLRMHAMHLAAVLGLLGTIAPAARLPKLIAGLPALEGRFPLALYSHIATSIICLVFLILCIRSFIRARVLKKQGKAAY